MTQKDHQNEHQGYEDRKHQYVVTLLSCKKGFDTRSKGQYKVMIQGIQVLQFHHYYHVKCIFLVLFEQSGGLIVSGYALSELNSALQYVLEDRIDSLLKAQLKKFIRIIAAFFYVFLLFDRL